MAPVPAKKGESFCLYPDEPIGSSHWEVFNVLGVSIGSHDFTAPSACWNTAEMAPGVYFVRLKLKYFDGRETAFWKKVVVIP